jgi:hypothetical protein
LGFKHLHSLKYVSDNLSLHAYHELTQGVEWQLFIWNSIKRNRWNLFNIYLLTNY